MITVKRMIFRRFGDNGFRRASDQSQLVLKIFGRTCSRVEEFKETADDYYSLFIQCISNFPHGNEAEVRVSCNCDMFWLELKGQDKQRRGNDIGSNLSRKCVLTQRT